MAFAEVGVAAGRRRRGRAAKGGEAHAAAGLGEEEEPFQLRLGRLVEALAG